MLARRERNATDEQSIGEIFGPAQPMLMVARLAAREPLWLSAVASTPAASDFFVMTILGYGGPDEWSAATKALLAAGLDADTRSDIALRVIMEHHTGDYLGSPLPALLLPDTLPHLRGLVEQSPLEMERFHFSAASTLAHLGDAETLAMLDRKAQGAAAMPRRLGQYFVRYRRFIQLQSTPAALLAFLADPASSSRDELNDKLWSLTRLRELGFAPQQIREALLAGQRGIRSAAGSLEGMAQVSLKSAAIDLGLLTDADLPDIVLPKGPKPVP